VPQLSCVVDSSCVIALDHLDLLPQLSLLFSEVLLPKGVRRELYRRRGTKNRVRNYLSSLGFVQKCNQYEQTTVDLLLIEKAFQDESRDMTEPFVLTDDRGETETVVQATERGAVAIIDDRWGRTLASRFELECHGTLWVLEQFFNLELVAGSQLRAHCVTLLDRGIHLPHPAVNDLLRRAGQEPIERA
jgi:predicted nucleic acid-binding protein